MLTGLDLLNFTSDPMSREKRDLSQMPVVFIPEVYPSLTINRTFAKTLSMTMSQIL